MTRKLEVTINSGEALMLGQAIGLHPDVSVHATEHGVVIGDTNTNPPVSLDQYLGRLCAATNKPYFVPTQAIRDTLILSLGFADSTKTHLLTAEESEPVVHG